MRIEYLLTPDDWAAFGEYCARNSPHLQSAKNRGILNGVLLALMIGLATCIFTKNAVPLVIATCAAIGWSWNASGRLVAHVRKDMASKERRCLRGVHVLEVLPAGLRSKCDITDSTVAWIAIREVIETSDHIFVMLDELQGHVIPKQRISAGDVRDFLLEVAKYRTADQARFVEPELRNT